MYLRAIKRGLRLISDVDLDKIDLDTLDMRSHCGCVLGQVYGSYHDGLRMLDFDHDRLAQIDHGFDIDRYTSLSPAKYQQLTQEWKNAITKRRNDQRED
jgi:hypothetical protein